MGGKAMIDTASVEALANAIKQEPQDTNNKYDAVVSRIDNEGVIWVNLAGSDIETPTASSSSEVEQGDYVVVEWRNNKLYISGNSSNPSAGVIRVDAVERATNVAREAANNAVADATRAREAAESVEGIARHAEEVAESVEGIAESAKTAADTAFTNLSQVQSVLEVAQWIATHGTYVKATVFNPNATYYTITATQVTEPSDDDKDSQGVLIYYELDNGIYVRTTDTSVQSGKTYYRVTGTPVAQPSAEHIADYYTLAVSEAMADYVQSHLALTDEGLWIIKDGSGYKLKLTDYGAYIVAPDGTTVVNQNTADGNIIRALNGTIIAHLGYGEGQAAEGRRMAPYYTLGVRKSTSADYDSSKRYSVGDLVTYNGQIFCCIKDIRTPEQWTPEHWQLAIGGYSLAEGFDTTASGPDAHAEGNKSVACGWYSHAEGFYAIAGGEKSHAEGSGTEARGVISHAEGNEAIARGDYSHAQNYWTVAYGRSQTVIGEFNKEVFGIDPAERGPYLLVAGNGESSSKRSDAFAIKWDGDVELALDTTAVSGDDLDIYTALQTLNWDSDVIV